MNRQKEQASQSLTIKALGSVFWQHITTYKSPGPAKAIAIVHGESDDVYYTISFEDAFHSFVGLPYVIALSNCNVLHLSTVFHHFHKLTEGLQTAFLHS